MIPYSTGTRLYIDDGETVDLSLPFDSPEPIVLENCELVVFVQAHQTREVLQAAKIKLTNFEMVDIDEQAELPFKFNLSQNYPNPFNAKTSISYTIAEAGQVTLDIFDIRGRKVRTAFSGMQNPGNYHIIWDGLDDSGKPVASGLYLYRLNTEGKSVSKKMIFMK